MKHILLVFGLILSIGSVNAQTAGVKGGLSISGLNSSDGDVEDKNALTGWTAGIFFNYGVTELFALQTEVNYTLKGGKYSIDGADYKSKSQYLELPVLLHIYVARPLYIYGGPQVSFLTDVKTTYDLGDQIEVVVDEDEDNYRRADIGAAFGAGLEFERLMLDARVVLGVVDYDKERTLDNVVYEARNLRNFAFNLTAGIRF